MHSTFYHDDVLRPPPSSIAVYRRLAKTSIAVCPVVYYKLRWRSTRSLSACRSSCRPSSPVTVRRRFPRQLWSVSRCGFCRVAVSVRIRCIPWSIIHCPHLPMLLQVPCPTGCHWNSGSQMTHLLWWGWGMLQFHFLLHFIISLIFFSCVSVGDKCCCCRRRYCRHWSHAELSVTSLSSTPSQGSSACSRQRNRRARCCLAVVEVTGYVLVLCSGSLCYLSNFPSLLSKPYALSKPVQTAVASCHQIVIRNMIVGEDGPTPPSGGHTASASAQQL